MRIDLHADDLGATHSVNTNILRAWRAGSLDGVSVIANGDALHNAATEINNIKRPLRIAVHLNLCEGYAIAKRSKVGLLVDDHGRFYYGFLGIWKLYLSSNKSVRQQLLQQVEVEWREQIKRVIYVFSPWPVTKVDGHIHIHMLPFLFPIAARLAQEYGLSEIRISREIFHFSLKESLSTGFTVNIVKHLLLNLLARQAYRVAQDNALKSPDAIAGVLYSGCMTYRTALAAARAAHRAHLNWLEIVFHPGRAIPEEAHRWSGRQSTVGRFYMDPHRDIERDALINMTTRHL